MYWGICFWKKKAKGKRKCFWMRKDFVDKVYPNGLFQNGKRRLRVSPRRFGKLCKVQSKSLKKI
jgi:hypothetical protein